MAIVGVRFIKTYLIYCAIITAILILGCIDNTDEKSVEIISVSTPTTPIKEDVSIYNSNEGTFTHIFKVNDEDMMFDTDIQLLGFSNEESIALIMVDNSPYSMQYNKEKMIKDYIIKVTDVDNTTQSVKIVVKQIR